MVVTRTHVFVDGDTLTAAQLNTEFNNLLNAPAIVNADISAGAAIAVSKIATGLSGALVGTTDTQELSNKTLDKPLINASVQGVQSYSPGSGGTATLDLSLGNVHLITMPGGNISIAVTNATVGQFFLVRVLQDSSGSRTTSWFSTTKWPNGTAPTNSGANKVDTYIFQVISSGNYDGFIAGQGLS